MKIIAYRCSFCGGDVKVVEYKHLSKCSYCGSSFYVLDNNYSAVVLKISITKDEAIQKLNDYMSCANSFCFKKIHEV